MQLAARRVVLVLQEFCLNPRWNVLPASGRIGLHSYCPESETGPPGAPLEDSRAYPGNSETVSARGPGLLDGLDRRPRSPPT